MLFLFTIARASMSSMYLSPQMALKKLQASAPAHFKPLLTPDTKGDTFLHHAAHKGIDAADFQGNIAVIGRAAAIAMAKTVNHKGDIPLKIVQKAFEHDPSHIIPKTIFALTRDYHPDDEVFNRNDVLAQYEEKSLTVAAREHLNIACKVIETVQGYGISSGTYPSVNDMRIEEYCEITSKIFEMRLSVSEQDNRILRTFPQQKPPALMMGRQFAHLENERAHVLSFRSGNCFEYAMLGLHIFLTQYKKTCAEFYRLVDGDHAFVVIGRDKNGDAARPETFGEDAVVCDVHAQRAFLATETPEKMMGWTRGVLPPGRSKELTAWTRTSYNPAYHSLRMAFSLTENHLHHFRI